MTLLQIECLTKKFGRKTVLDELSFTFKNGVYGLLGPNGAGKTTLIRCITGLYKTAKNSIVFDGTPISTNKNYLDQIGYLPQKFGLFKDLKVKEMMLLLANLKNMPREEAQKSVLSCVDLVNLSDRIDSKVASLSGGMIRRLGIAQALLNDPKIIIFDEPTAGLDPEERLRFKNIIAEIKGNRVIIISTHIVEDVESVCDQVSIMKDKSIAVSGSCKEIQQLAANKVYVIPEAEKYSINGKHIVQKQYETEGVKMLRFISRDPQETKPANPDVEDGYICVLKDI